ncbi:MAG: hypothetical protein A2020_00285 [Lentisphaerae bacterium GWF2_45_14]|nr:MAG: hypothetical protein A2020_00285 [Lentisphaerae bacterium GWF2_45_14]
MKCIFTFDEIKRAMTAQLLNAPKNGLDGHISSVVTDTREDCADSLFIAIKGENFDGHAFCSAAIEKGAAALCVNSADALSSQVKVPVFVVEDTTKALQSLALFHRRRLGGLTVTALTGSCGKTSTKEMIRSIYSAAFGESAVYATAGNTNNHVGVPQNILNLNEKHKICVLEMGTNHPGEIEVLSKIAEPDISVITMVGHSHLEFFGDLKGVAQEKAAIFSHMNAAGTAIIPDDTPSLKVIEKAASKFNVMRFGCGKNSEIQVKYLGGNISGSSFELFSKESKETVIVNWKLSGRHQTVNAGAAACAGLAVGIDLKTIASGLENCVLPGMRMKTTVRNDTTWINDAYNANPDSVISALTWLSEFSNPSHLVIVLGDMLELGETTMESHQKVLRFAAEKFKDAKVVAIGPKMIAACADRSFKAGEEILTFESSDKAAESVRLLACRGCTVFLKGSRGMKLEKIEPSE